MSDFNIESFIKGLSPELQEKARTCRSTDELLKLADDNNVELPQEALGAVSGGAACSKSKSTCPSCGSEDVSAKHFEGIVEHKCKSCGHTW